MTTEASGRRQSLSTRARALATEAHEGQVDKVGAAYIGHPARIAKAVRGEGYSDEVEAVAWLHDVVEDTDMSLADLYVFGFPAEVIDAVDAISKRKGEKFEAYYERVKANPMALVVKWHDVADNADPARLAKVAPDTRERLRAKYERAKALLSDDASGQTAPAPAVTADDVSRGPAGGSSEARLWVDDLRPAPDGWLWAKTSQEAIDALLDESFDVMSLDHDLGGDDTSRRVVLWLCEYGAANWPGEVRVHSANPVGAEWLTGMVERYAPRRPGGVS